MSNLLEVQSVSKKFGDLGFECFVHIDNPLNFVFCDKLKTAQSGRYIILKDKINKFIVDTGPFYVLMVTDNLSSILLNKNKLSELFDRIELAKPKVLIFNIEDFPKSSPKNKVIDANSIKKLLLECSLKSLSVATFS